MVGTGVGVATTMTSIYLSKIGFTTAGIAKASYIAVFQSGIGNVAGGSLFATLQSYGATGLFVMTGFIGGITAIGGGTYLYLKGRK